jgi:transposase InsO family protein
MQHPSLAGSRYVLVFTDDFSRKSWTYFLKSKDETFEKFRIFKEMIENETGNKIKTLRSDRGEVYLSNTFKFFCSDHGIRCKLTQVATPQQNGVLEKKNRTLIERARSLALECNLPPFLWIEAVATANLLVNHSPTRANHGTIPEEKYSGKKPDVSNFRIFGCMAYSHVPKESRKKLESKTLKCLFVGYDTKNKAYRLYDRTRRKIILNRDVVFVVH